MASFFRQCIVFTGFVDVISASSFHHRGTTPWSEELRVLARRTLQAKQGEKLCIYSTEMYPQMFLYGASPVTLLQAVLDACGHREVVEQVGRTMMKLEHSVS